MVDIFISSEKQIYLKKIILSSMNSQKLDQLQKLLLKGY